MCACLLACLLVDSSCSRYTTGGTSLLKDTILNDSYETGCGSATNADKHYLFYCCTGSVGLRNIFSFLIYLSGLMASKGLSGLSNSSLPPFGSGFGTSYESAKLMKSTDMFKIMVETSKGSNHFMSYYVNAEVWEMINDIVLQRGFIEASIESCASIQRHHGHRVASGDIKPKTSDDSGIGQSLTTLDLGKQQMEVKKLQAQLEEVTKQASTLSHQITMNQQQQNQQQQQTVVGNKAHSMVNLVHHPHVKAAFENAQPVKPGDSTSSVASSRDSNSRKDNLEFSSMMNEVNEIGTQVQAEVSANVGGQHPNATWADPNLQILGQVPSQPTLPPLPLKRPMTVHKGKRWSEQANAPSNITPIGYKTL